MEPSKNSDLKSRNPKLYEKLLAGREGRHCFMSRDGRFIYHLGIIDYLQDFNFDKWGENKLKSLYYDGDLISAIPPVQYCLRFFKFMQRHVIVN